MNITRIEKTNELKVKTLTMEELAEVLFYRLYVQKSEEDKLSKSTLNKLILLFRLELMEVYRELPQQVPFQKCERTGE